MTNTFTFDRLFIFEMANNHMGDVDHAIQIIHELKQITEHFNFQFGIKLQYRDLPTFIHPDFQNRTDIKYIKRFTETSLTSDEFLLLKDKIVSYGFIPICTPFDEPSVDLIEEHDFSILKIASASFTDWPLLERIALTNLPIIASTAGATLDEIDQVVTFFTHRQKDFCLMHCVGEYPTPCFSLDLNQIDLFRKRYPDIPIGYSTHESPSNIDAIKVAIAKGAVAFERHVGIETKYNLNEYSSTPSQIAKWLFAANQTYEMCGISNTRRHFSAKEIEDLNGLKRGVYAKENIKIGEKINSSNTFFAIPNIKLQILANDMSKYTNIIVNSEITKGAPIAFPEVYVSHTRDQVQNVITKAKEMLQKSKIALPHMLDFELSHHYGIDMIEECGAVIINCINREYCKKLIIVLPGQKHPRHHHKKKEESFQILYGTVDISLDNCTKKYYPGDIITVERGVEHSFTSSGGAIFEEISTTHYPDDSYYNDPQILKNKDRKTQMTFWKD